METVLVCLFPLFFRGDGHSTIVKPFLSGLTKMGQSPSGQGHTANWRPSGYSCPKGAERSSKFGSLGNMF